MRSWRVIVLSLGITSWFTGPAAAQFSLALDGSRAVSAGQVVLRGDVQKELGLTFEQIQQLKELDDATRQKVRSEFDKLAEKDPAERDKARVELVKKTSEEQFAALGKILTAGQIKRLKEVTWQIAGSQALKNREVEDALKLTDDQKKRIQEIMRARIAEMAKVFQEDKEGIEKARDKADTIRFKALDDVVAELNADQKTQFAAMKGKPFPVKRAPTLAKLMDPVWSKGDVAKPGEDANDLRWVTERSDSWAPAPEERKMDLIGWADGLIPALRLARKHNRPVFIFTLDGELGRGRC